MADDAVRTLICIIEGESVVFKVKPTGSVDVMDLKDLIKEKRKDVIHVDSASLTLWKVRISMASDDATGSPAGR